MASGSPALGPVRKVGAGGMVCFCPAANAWAALVCDATSAAAADRFCAGSCPKLISNNEIIAKNLICHLFIEALLMRPWPGTRAPERANHQRVALPQYAHQR